MFDPCMGCGCDRNGQAPLQCQQPEGHRKGAVVISKPQTVIVDLDGTLALMGDRRGPYEYDKCGGDLPNRPVMDLVWILADHYLIVAVSGREETCRDLTEKWLVREGVDFEALFMRRAKDNRPDTVVKAEIYHQEIEGHYDVAFVLDDRSKVVKMWRSLGLTCLQVADGEF